MFLLIESMSISNSINCFGKITFKKTKYKRAFVFKILFVFTVKVFKIHVLYLE